MRIITITQSAESTLGTGRVFARTLGRGFGNPELHFGRFYRIFLESDPATSQCFAVVLAALRHIEPVSFGLTQLLQLLLAHLWQPLNNGLINRCLIETLQRVPIPGRILILEVHQCGAAVLSDVSALEIGFLASFENRADLLLPLCCLPRVGFHQSVRRGVWVLACADAGAHQPTHIGAFANDRIRLSCQPLLLHRTALYTHRS